MTHINIRHGHSKRNHRTPEYLAWKKMIARCSNSNLDCWKDYGGRGISVSPEWISNYMAFYSYIGPRPDNAHSIDRINNDGNYEPGNVRWANRKTQADNRRYASNRNKTNCLVCKKLIISSPSKIRIFCSVKCTAQNKENRYVVSCDQCKNEFKYIGFRVRKFCCRKCYYDYKTST